MFGLGRTLTSLRHTLVAATGALALFAASSANAGVISVVGDVNADINPTFYSNVLGSSTNVLFGRGVMFGVDGISNHYASLVGVSISSSTSALTAASLSGVDLLVFNQVTTWNINLVYTAAELTAISNFLNAGGDVLLVAEGTNVSQFANFNGFLSGIGSDIEYSMNTSRSSVQPYTISPHPLTAGVTSWSTSANNKFTGGTALVTDANGNVLVATSGSVVTASEPGVLALVAFGFIALSLRARRRA